MFERYSGWIAKHRQLIAPIIGVGVLCFVFWLLYGNMHRDERSIAAADQKEISLSKCFSFENWVMDQVCAQKALDAKYDNTTDAYDLKAQQDMAMWALLMFVVTGAGVVFVALTLNETKNATRAALIAANAAVDANDTAREIGHTQLRAYAGITKVTAKQIADSPTGEQFLLEVQIKNFGQTPAIRLKAEIATCDGPLPEPKSMPNLPFVFRVADMPASEIQPSMAITLAPKANHKFGTAGSIRNSLSTYIIAVRFSYEDVFSKRYETTQYYVSFGAMFEGGLFASSLWIKREENHEQG